MILKWRHCELHDPVNSVMLRQIHLIPGALLSEISGHADSKLFFPYFVFSSKIHKRWLILWIHCKLSEFSNKLLKQQEHLIFCLDHVSLYSESAAWLPDPCLDRDKSSHYVIPYQAFEAAGFEQDIPRNEIKGTMWDHFFQFNNTLNPPV